MQSKSNFVNYIIYFFFSLSIASQEGTQQATQVFYSIDELLAYSSSKSILLKNNEVQLTKDKKGKLAAILGTIDPTGSNSLQYTDNTTLGVNLFPAEIFGGEPGTFQEVQTGVRFNTNQTTNIDIKLINLVGWSNLKLAKININLTESNNQISLKNLQENIANNYFNIVNLQKQILTTEQNLQVSDTLYTITKNKYEQGLVKQQDVNDAKINYLSLSENIRQLNYLLDQYYISLKILIDVPENENIIIENKEEKPFVIAPEVNLNDLGLEAAVFQERYMKANYQAKKSAFLPTLSFQFSNSNNLYNTTFDPFQGDWINSNYIGLRLQIPIPNAKNISERFVAKYDLKMAKNNTKQAEIQAELNQKNLEKEYEKALSQATSDDEILALRKDSYQKNMNLYQEGLLSLEVTLDSFNIMVTASYNLLSSQTNVQLTLSKISINNNIN